MQQFVQAKSMLNHILARTAATIRNFSSHFSAFCTGQQQLLAHSACTTSILRLKSLFITYLLIANTVSQSFLRESHPEALLTTPLI